MTWILRKISDEQIIELVKTSTSFRQICLKVGLTGGGSAHLIRDRILKLGCDISHFTGKLWNKGQTKDTHPSIKQCAETYSKNHKGKPGRKHSKAARQKMSRRASKRSFLNGLVKTKWYSIFNPYLNCNVKVQGTWEYRYAQWLNTNHILWIRPKKTFSWRRSFDDIAHAYHPDFYLVTEDVYVEIKGYMWKDVNKNVDDKLKMKLVQEQNPNLKLKILMKMDLKNLGIL